MDHERHDLLSSLFAELSALPAGLERDARLVELCAGDSKLEAALKELLHFDAEEDELSPGAILRSDLEGAWAQEGETIEDADVLSRYKIERLLGEGGFGSVYLAREEEPIPRLVAIKVIKPGMDTREVLARFDSERRALATMDHPGIARAFTAGTDQRGRPYFVMEYVEGQVITTYCDEHQLDVRRRLEVFVEVCEAIQHAHFKGILHRDIKPANVLVTTIDGRPTPKTIDFGIAKAMEQADDGASALTRAGQLVGTIAAMSPEQLRGEDVDTRVDVYALGGLLYELLCGYPPFSFEADTGKLENLRQQILDEDPPRPSVRARGDSESLITRAKERGTSPRALERTLADDLDWIVMKALEKDPARRYASPSDLAADVKRYLVNEAIMARPPSRSYQAAKFARRHLAGLVAAGVMLVLLVAGSIGTGIGWRKSVQSLGIAEEQTALAVQRLERARAAEADALAINAFLNNDLLSSVSPESMGYDVSMRAVLDAAAGRIEDRVDLSPRVEREIRSTLGHTYRALGLMEPAMEQLVAALAIEGPAPLDGIESDDFRTAELRARGPAQYELGRVHLQLNQNVEAERVLRELWTQCSGLLGKDDHLTIDALHFLGVSLAEVGRFDEARKAFDASRSQALASFGEHHELAIQALHSQGLLNLSIEMAEGVTLDGTLELLEQALGESRAQLGSDDPRTVRRILNLSSALEVRGALSEATALLQEAYERSARVQGPTHPTTAAAALALGGCYFDAGSTEEAAAAMEEALEIVRPLGAGYPILSQALSHLCEVRKSQGRLSEAEELGRSALESFELQGRPVAPLLELLGVISEEDGRPDDAARWRQLASEQADEHPSAH